MIKAFEHKIPLQLSESYQVILESGKRLPGWELILSDEQSGLIEWSRKKLFGLRKIKIRAYLKQQRPEYTLATIYVNLPLQFIDPFKLADRTFAQLTEMLNRRLL